MNEEKKFQEKCVELKTSAQEPAATKYGDFELLEQIGSGGMGLVYRANQRSMQRVCAIKVMNAEAVDDSSVKRFLQEAKLICTLDHPNIVKVYAIDYNDNNRAYIVMEWLEGKSLAEYLKEKGKLSLAEFRNILSQTLKALSYAHQRGIIHRDIKPGNVFICNTTDSGVLQSVKLLDFGIAKDTTNNPDEKLTRTGTILGSPAYMSPEQARGAPPAIASDLYSAGILMYECLAGMPPFSGDTALDAMYKHINELVDVSRLPSSPAYARLNACILKCLEKDPEKRYQNADSLLEDLSNCWELLEPSPRVAPWAPGKHWNLTGKKVLFAVMLVLCAGLAAIAISMSKKLPVRNADELPIPAKHPQNNLQGLRQAERYLQKAESYYQIGDKEKGAKLEKLAISVFDGWISDSNMQEQEIEEKLRQNNIRNSERKKLEDQRNIEIPNNVYNAQMELGQYFQEHGRLAEAAKRYHAAAKSLTIGALGDEAYIAESKVLCLQKKPLEAIKVLSEIKSELGDYSGADQLELIKIDTALASALFDANEIAKSQGLYAEAWSKAKKLPEGFFEKIHQKYPACFIEVLGGLAKSAEPERQEKWYEQSYQYIKDAQAGRGNMHMLVKGTPNFTSIHGEQFRQIAGVCFSAAEYYKTKKPERANELLGIARDFESAR